VLSGELHKITWGPVTVQPAEENTQCIQARLGNLAAIKVHQMHNILGPGSHHLIVYKDDMTTEERTTPFDCDPFTGALNLTGQVAPIMITQRADDPLYLPEGVAYSLDANQMLRVEMHYINATDNPIEAQATVELYAAPEETIRDEANMLFIGTPDIDIGPGETKSIHQFFTPSRADLDLANAKFFAITGHTHQMGTSVTVNIATAPAATMQAVYNPDVFEWDEPETQVHKPEFLVPTDLTGGFDFTCQYVNTSNEPIGFGESANDEMCFFWAYYYPSQGAHVCVHTNFRGLNLDICCPDAGAALCNMINDL
jgi:hypothetical protein